jgi:U3 small nucleolar RNA-associated protein 21
MVLVQQSSVIKPISTLGVVVRRPPVSMVRLGSEHFVTASVGSSFQVYNTDDLHLQYLSRPLGGEIGSIVSVGECTVVSVGSRILAFHKMLQLAEFIGHSDTVTTMRNLGDSFLISASKSEVFVWNLPNLTKQTQPLSKPVEPKAHIPVEFRVTAIIPIPTYINKMLFGGENGQLELWNINTGKKVYAFKSSGVENTPITALAPAPVLDVVGVGYGDGSIAVMNLKSDELIMTLNQKEHGSVSSMSFRNDSVGGQLVTGTDKGDLVIWDLNKKAVHSFHKQAHGPGGVSTVAFLDTLPLMISAGQSDNALCVHIFDLPNGGCRLLKERRGFTSDLDFLMPYGEHDLLVGSNNEVGRLNLIQSHQDKVWSQKNLQNQTSGQNSLMPWKFRNMPQGMLPRLTSISHCPDRLRHYDWPTVITTHEGLPDAYIWSPHQEALVNRMLIIKDRKKTTGSEAPRAVQVAVSTCGNYAVMGLDNGELHRFNVQSCYHRGLVGTLPSAPVAAKFLSARELLTADKEAIRIWNVVPRPSLISTLTCVSDIARIETYGFLCAVSHTEANRVSVVDIHTDRRVRTIEVSGKVSAMAWASGGKWLAIATADKRMIVYDMPTASVIDKVEFSSTVIALRFTQSNAKLVTSHEGGKGSIRVWQNVALLHGPGMLSSDYVLMDQEPTKVRKETKRPNEEIFEGFSKRVRMEGEMVVVGGSKWQHVLKLDEIKERNKPIRPAEKPKSAPFFLPVKYQGVQPVFAPPVNLESEEVEMKDQMKVDHAAASGFLELVKGEQFEKLYMHLVKATASGVHICISELDEDEEALGNFIRFLAVQTKSGQSVDLVATWTSLFLKSYGQQIRGRSEFEQPLLELAQAVRDRQTKFELETNQLQCLLKVTAALQLHR